MVDRAVLDKPVATKIIVEGGYTYIATAIPPRDRFTTRIAHEASPEWRVQRMDSDGSIEWADGDAEYDNIATDLTALTYR